MIADLRRLSLLAIAMLSARPKPGGSVSGHTKAHRPSPGTSGASQADTTQSTQQTATDDQLEWLVREYGTVLYKVAYAITRNRSLAEEVVQDALFKAWSSMPSWEDDIPIRWLRRVTKNRAISVMRKENRSMAEDNWTFHADVAPGTDRVVEARQALSAVEKAMQGLDEQSRLMVVLRETEGTSYEELADLLDLTPSAVKTRLYRARHALKTELRDWEL